MSAWPERRRTSPLQALLDRASAFVLRPPEAARPDLRLVAAPEPEPGRPVVAVVGLAPRAGASTLARALAGRLAGLDPAGAAVLFTADRPRGGPATAAASRLAARVADAGCEGVRAAGRLCLVPAGEPLAPVAAPRRAPLVVDVGHGAPSETAVALAEHVVLVCPPAVEPALAAAVETSLREGDHFVSVVLNRALGGPPPGLEHALTVPDARLAAQLTVACREPRGALASIAAELAERSLAEVAS